MKSKIRSLVIAGSLVVAAFGGAAAPASADRVCANVDSTIGFDELERLGVGSISAEPICVRLP